MGLSDLRNDFLAHQTGLRLSRRGLFKEKAPGALSEAVRTALSEQFRKERALDEEARRMVEKLGTQIAQEGADSNELYRKIRQKLAERQGIVL